MAEFTPITTQEEFDAIIKSRLEREANKVRGEFADYESIKNSLAEKNRQLEELNGKISGFETQISDLNAKLSASETGSAKTRIAYEMGLPFELSKRLTGETEDEIRKDADNLKLLIRKSQPAQPVFNPDPRQGDSKEEAYKQMIQDMNQKN